MISTPCKAAGFGEISNRNFFSFLETHSVRAEQSRAPLRKGSGGYGQGHNLKATERL